MPHLVLILFVFALGACVGSFLNVVVWRLPRGESLSSPPSHCPRCNQLLRWYDNIPVFGWLKLGGKCRFCAQPISVRYPIVEAVTGLLFVFYYVMFFLAQVGPCSPLELATAETGAIAQARPLDVARDWPMYGLYMVMIAALLAASLIDAELFIIPTEIPWVLAGIGIVVHAIIDTPATPGALNVNPLLSALAAGGGVGLLVSILLQWRGIIPISFPDGEPLEEQDRAVMLAELEKARREGRALDYDAVPPKYTKPQIRTELRKEVTFLLPPLLLATAAWALVAGVPAIGDAWFDACQYNWVTGLCGAVLGALVGGLVVWVTRILGTLGFGRVAMGLGDVHLMFGVGAVIGAGAATVAFFVAPFFGILTALYRLIFRSSHEMPYGPYLAMASAAMLLFYCPIAAYLAPGVAGLVIVLRNAFGAAG